MAYWLVVVVVQVMKEGTEMLKGQVTGTLSCMRKERRKQAQNNSPQALHAAQSRTSFSVKGV